MNKEYLSLRQISFFLTNRCNLKCEYCYNEKKDFQSLTYNNAIRALELYFNILTKDSKYLWVTFTGGEPLIESNLLFKIVKYSNILAKKRNKIVKYNLTTNGTLINHLILKEIKKNKIHICFSIDGTKESHDKYRKDHSGRGTHDRIIKNLKEYINYSGRSKLRVRMTIQPSEGKHLKKNIDYLISEKVNNIHFAPNYEAEWSTIQIKEYFNQIKILLSQLSSVYKKIKIEPLNAYYTSSYSFEKKWGPYEHQCGLLLTVSPSGDVFPCPRFVSIKSKYNLGNIEEPASIVRGLINWNNDLKKIHKKTKFHFFCPANNCKINNVASKMIPLFFKFHRELIENSYIGCVRNNDHLNDDQISNFDFSIDNSG